MSISSAASGVATSPPQQQQLLPPLKQIRFVNNEGQPPAKRRRINAACVQFFVLSPVSVVSAACLCAWRRSSLRTREVALLTRIFNRLDAERVENAKLDAMERNRYVQRARRMDMSVWAMQK
jgi:hypothetical protein